MSTKKSNKVSKLVRTTSPQMFQAMQHVSKDAKTIMQHQQGDVVLNRLSKLPKGAVKINSNTKVLQHGEGGHCHRFLDSAVIDYYSGTQSKRDIDAIDNLAGISRITDVGGDIYVDVREPTMLVHGMGPDATYDGMNHGPQFVAPGVYKLDIKREMNIFERAVRQVRD